MDIIKMLSEELGITENQVNKTVELLDDGNTVPFIARYRKEVTGGLNDEVLRKLADRLTYLRNLQQRKEDVIRIIEEQGNMTDELRLAIENAKTLQETEDIYRPFRPKRRTRATIAKEKGLEPLALMIAMSSSKEEIDAKAPEFINPEKGVENAEEAIAGAMDIVAEQISDNAEYRKRIRNLTAMNGMVVSRQNTEEDTVYSQYYEFSQPVNKIANHRVLALDRGEKEGALTVKIELDTDDMKAKLARMVMPDGEAEYLRMASDDAYDRLIAPSIENEVRGNLTEQAQEKAIELFSKNLRQLLLQPPIKGKTVLGFDPGYRTGCKTAVVDETGKVLDTEIVFCTLDHHDKEKAKKSVLRLIEKYNVDLIAIGNGTASKETEIFVANLIKEANRKVQYMMVSEAGASVYSASELAAAEFPDYDVAQRSAVSIARRTEDPLAELVKIDPKSIGVGQYQHDMNQKRLGEALEGVVEDCVNSVGVDVNTASARLLSFVAGINKTVADNIVKYREENGAFENRSQLKKVSKLGAKAFEQCAGFMRIPGCKNVLDNTAVHPESYKLAEKILELCGYTLEDVRTGKISELKARSGNANLSATAESFGVGMATATDIIAELLKPGRDPREELDAPVLRSDIMSMENLKPGMVLT
ncbi:MAG: RNA-binding transcriptional accessory protein, partial [Clostridia bacterium]|nr:RNA-binding transcriptional accessory protein [Clostridia bacterium]